MSRDEVPERALGAIPLPEPVKRLGTIQVDRRKVFGFLGEAAEGLGVSREGLIPLKPAQEEVALSQRALGSRAATGGVLGHPLVLLHRAIGLLQREERLGGAQVEYP